jgi:hypothetical protein
VRLEGLGKLQIFHDLIGTRTRGLPAGSIVPQPTTLQRVPREVGFHISDLRTCRILVKKKLNGGEENMESETT